jgi:hypothetical protein
MEQNMESMVAEIRKGKKGIEDVVGSYRGQAVEETRRIIAEGDGDIARLLELFMSGQRIDKIDDVLTPEQINAFLQSTAAYEEDSELFDIHRGAFVSCLIQTSYEAGYNDFHLDTTALRDVRSLGAWVKGAEERPIQITISGNIGHHCGRAAHYMRIHVTGNTGQDFAMDARYSVFTVEGGVEHNCGLGAEKCTFKTPDKATLVEMLSMVEKGNKVYLIHPDGKEEMFRRW